MIDVAGGLLGHSWFVRYPKSHGPGTSRELERNESFVREKPYEAFSLIDFLTSGCQNSGDRCDYCL